MSRSAKPSSLWNPTIPESERHPGYEHVRGSPGCVEDRAYVEAWWARYEPLADNHFRDQFQRDFHSRVWEMELALILQDLGLSPTSKATGPDLRISVNGMTVWIEAIAPAKGSGANEVPNRKSGSVPEQQIRRRYISAIGKKLSKWRKYVSDGTVDANDVFVVALSGAKVPLSDLELGDYPRIVEMVLDSVAAPQTTINDPSISAIIFSPNHLKNLPQAYGRPRENDLTTVHNPSARHPLPLRSIQAGKEYWIDGSSIRLKDWRPPKERAPRWSSWNCFRVTRDVAMTLAPSSRTKVCTLREAQTVVYFRRRGKLAYVTAMPLDGEEWLCGWVRKKYLREIVED